VLGLGVKGERRNVVEVVCSHLQNSQMFNFGLKKHNNLSASRHSEETRHLLLVSAVSHRAWQEEGALIGCSDWLF